MQQCLVTGNRLGRTGDADHLRRKLAAFDIVADGGWYLAQDEIHSGYDAPLSVPEQGDQVWGP